MTMPKHSNTVGLHMSPVNQLAMQLMPERRIRTHIRLISSGSNSSFDCINQMRELTFDLLDPLAIGNSKQACCIPWDNSLFPSQRDSILIRPSFCLLCFVYPSSAMISSLCNPDQMPQLSRLWKCGLYFFCQLQASKSSGRDQSVFHFLITAGNQ